MTCTATKCFKAFAHVVHSDHNTPETRSNPCTLLYSLLGCFTSVFRSPFGPDLPGSCLPMTTGLPPLHSAGGPQSLHFPPQPQHLPSLYPPLVVQGLSPILALSRTAVTSSTTIWSLMTLESRTTRTPRPSLLVEVDAPLGPAIAEVLFGGVGTRPMSPCPTPMWSMIITAWGWSQMCSLSCGGPSPIPPASIS